MRELGYSAEYRYEPSFAHPVHQDFLPPELQGTRFVSPPPPDLARESAEGRAPFPTRVLPTPAGTGPGACQRQFQLGSRAVDLDLLLEWEQKQNGGQAWAGRAALERRIACASQHTDDPHSGPAAPPP